MRVSIDNMEHFKAVAHWGNLNLAAKMIAISPSALSRSIKIIEEDLGYLLFTRSGRNIYINQDGKRILDKFENILNSYEEIYLDSKPSELKGNFKIGASHWLASYLLPKPLDKLISKNKFASFELFSQNSDTSILQVLSGEIDFAFCFSPKSHKDLNSFTISKGQLLLSAHKDHPLFKSKNKINEINKFSAIIHKANKFSFSCVDHPMFKKYSIKPKVKFYWDSDHIALELLQSKKYWTLLPEIIIKSDKSIRSVPPPKGWSAEYEIKIIWSKYSNSKNIEQIKEYFN